jgi:ABC-2 type transport system permease protein
MIRALVDLSFRSARNRVLGKLRRLRQPRYLISLLIGLAFFGWLVSAPGGKTAAVPETFRRIALTVVVWVGMLGAWALPSAGAGIGFTEAEIQLLFPAPLQRWHLLFYRLLRSQPGLLFTSIVFKLFVLRSGRFFGIWLALAVLNVYFMMVALARARLQRMGFGFYPRLVGGMMLCLATALLVVHSLDSGGFRSSFQSWQLEEAGRALNAGCFGWPAGLMFWVPSLVARPAVSGSLTAMIGWSSALFALGLLFFGLAVRTDVSFEDASIARSKRKARRIENQRRWQQGRRVLMRRVPAPFRLAEQGRPEVAILWKNLIAAGRITLPVLLAAGVIVLAAPAVFCLYEGCKAAWAIGAALSLAGLAVMTAAGPLLFRNDLRGDMEQIDLLKLLPISGFRMVLWQGMSTAGVVLAFQLVFLSLSAGFGLFLLPFSTWRLYAGWIPAALVVIFPIDMIQVIFRNAVVILLPGWVHLTHEPGNGFEAAGQRILLAMANLFVLFAALLPAGLVSLLVFWLAGFFFGVGPASGLIAAVPATLVLSVEIFLSVRFLGRQFERIDLANDLRISAGGG